jgi:peroxiredoxin
VSELSANIEGNSIYDSTWFELVGQEALRTFLKNYYRTYEYPEVLKKGANIPYFYLPDTSNNYFEPNNFRNQIVLINFWYPGCKGCIIRFREENELVEKYKDRPISIVNICTNAPSEEVWKSTIVKNNVKALNLLASDNWKERIKSSFGIRSYPHSVLINWNGKIVQNKCSRLSQTIGEQIDELLNEMEKEGNIL